MILDVKTTFSNSMYLLLPYPDTILDKGAGSFVPSPLLSLCLHSCNGVLSRALSAKDLEVNPVDSNIAQIENEIARKRHYLGEL
jgi:hypothetical protein